MSPHDGGKGGFLILKKYDQRWKPPLFDKGFFLQKQMCIVQVYCLHHAHITQQKPS
jgi:hypothetical protein